jgi:hypothetical protein
MISILCVLIESDSNPMIVFDLQCAHGHVFEAWFDSSDEFESQRAQGMVACPYCEDRHIEKAVMAPNVGLKANQSTKIPAPESAQSVALADTEMVEEAKLALKKLLEVQKSVEEHFDYVGTRFVEEARAIHAGVREEAGIWGEATPSDVAALQAEGIAVAPLPFPTMRKSRAISN